MKVIRQPSLIIDFEQGYAPINKLMMDKVESINIADTYNKP